jgi:hypothetical protein
MPDDSSTAAGLVVISSIASHKYKTRIESYEYKRERPGKASPTTANSSILFFPLPLQMPDDHYAANVKDFDLAEIGTTIDTFKDWGGSSIAEKIGAGAITGGIALAALSKLTGFASNATDKAAGALAGAAAALPFLGAYQGIARNPHTALIFDGMGLRQFTFNFRISPRNESESNQLNRSLNQLKLRMHPTYNSKLNSYALDYPFLFTVGFSGFDGIEGIPNVSPSFLVGMSVSNASQGNVFYKNGMPSIVDISLSFKEIDMKTREFFTGDTTHSIADPSDIGLGDRSTNIGGVGDH